MFIPALKTVSTKLFEAGLVLKAEKPKSKTLFIE